MSYSGEIPSTYEELLADYQTLSEQNEKQQAQIHLLTEELNRLKRLISGSKRERFIPEANTSQVNLELTPNQQSPFEVHHQTEEINYMRKKAKAKYTPHGRNPLPDHLPRKEIIIEPDEDTVGMKCIGKEVTQELDYEPPTLRVNLYIRPKYARPDGNGVVIATLPTRPVEKGVAGPGLLAHLAIGKYVDHLPLYRQRRQFRRQGVELATSTLADCISNTCEVLLPLYQLLSDQVLKTSYLMVDETSLRVQVREVKGKCHTGYYWVYFAPVQRLVLFDYRQSRSREGPEEMLRDFFGHLQTDGYQVYDDIGARNTIVHVACFAHARRYFTEALQSDLKRAECILTHIQKLYDIERTARQEAYTFAQRYDLRQRESLPLLAEMKAWLEVERYKVLPKSAIAKALAYMLKFWHRLNVYTTDGRIEIDNNLVENAIRPVALGRKNYLFAGSHNGARRGAIIYSLVCTAMLHDLEPFEYLRDVIDRISDHPHKRLHELLPQNYKRTDPTQ
jgi:transposase